MWSHVAAMNNEVHRALDPMSSTDVLDVLFYMTATTLLGLGGHYFYCKYQALTLSLWIWTFEHEPIKNATP